MADRYLETLFTPKVLAAQAQYYGQSQTLPSAPVRDPLSAEEMEFISRRDSFYLATITSDGWPYVQHRGGPAGFLKVLNPQTLGFADFKGNRQLLSTGNLATNHRVALLLMDYARRERLKIIGHARVLDAREEVKLADDLAPTPALRAKVERVFVIEVLSFDWNCPQYISPRYTEAEIRPLLEPLKARIAELERALAQASAKRD